MANRRNNVKIETTIESCRGEAKWQRVIELAEELKTGSPNYGKTQWNDSQNCEMNEFH